jgi:type III pantothenate kinase
MNLIIDIGNTSIKIAVFDHTDSLKYVQKLTSGEFFDQTDKVLKSYPVQYAVISQVGRNIPGIKMYFRKKNIPLYQVSAKMKLPFTIAYQTPETIGADRLGLVAGALLHTKNKNILIIDAGTCITYDFIDKNNIYHGGAISPGIYLRYKSLNDYTANLPLLTIPEKHPVALTGKNTISSIQSGVIRGVVNEIEGFIVKYNLKYPDFTVYLTGGDQKVLDRYIKNKIFVSSKFLLLEGINYLLNLNK